MSMQHRFHEVFMVTDNNKPSYLLYQAGGQSKGEISALGIGGARVSGRWRSL